MSITLITIEDGRSDYHAAAYRSAMEFLPKFDEYIHVDDRAHTLGYDGAIQRAWSQVTTDWVFHLEADFVFRKPVPVRDMVSLMIRHPYLQQVALKRQAINMEEIQAGGFMGRWPAGAGFEMDDGAIEFVTHRVNFTTNPCVYRGDLCAGGWPDGPDSEAVFSRALLAPQERACAFLGTLKSPPQCWHIGTVRSPEASY